MLILKKNRIEKDLVLIGGGHSHLNVLMNFIKNSLPFLRITLISNTIDTPYSGMLPGFIEGTYSWRDVNIDLYKLALMGNIRFVNEQVINLNGKNKLIYFKNRPAIHFDYLSINCGIESNYKKISGAKKFTTPLKPISELNFSWLGYDKEFKNIGIIGGGAAGTEVALAIKKRLNKKQNINIKIFTGKRGLLPNFNESSKNKVFKILKKNDIQIINNDPVKKVTDDSLITLKNSTYKVDKIILATNGVAPNWLKKTDLELCNKGFIITNKMFQTNFDYIFASGDIINFDRMDIQKSGVYAVRSGKVLSLNLRSFILNKKLRSYYPQKHILALVGLSNGKALANKMFFSNISKLNLLIKKTIDQKFINKYKILIPNNSKKGNYQDMECKGCAAKISQISLKKILPKEIITHSKDASQIPDYNELFHSVDMINSIITDPFILGKISANHALSDIYASGTFPISAQMILQLPSSAENIQTRDLEQIYIGAKMIFDENKCKINGGHTMVGEDSNPTIGFSVIGKSNNKNIHKEISHGDLVFLTGKIGSGLIFAGINNNKIDSFYQKEVLRQMITGNLKIGKILNKLNTLCCTDVTGFGLANHLINLINRNRNSFGFSIKLNEIPTFEGVEKSLKMNVRSTFYEKNYEAAKDFIYFKENLTTKKEILFDPQTVGGLVFVISKKSRSNVLNLLKINEIQYSIIGSVVKNKPFLNVI